MARPGAAGDQWVCPCAQQSDTKMDWLSHKQHIQLPELAWPTLSTKVEFKNVLNFH